MKTYMCEQYSPQWWNLRRGIPTASQFDRIMTPVKRQYSSAARKYARELVAESAVNWTPPFYASQAMQHGTNTEPEARAWYAFTYDDLPVQQVGFCVTDDGLIGCSPDFLAGSVGGGEIKCPQPDTHLGYLDDCVLPPDYACQVHGSLIVTGRQWWDFVSYCPGLPPFVVRVVPDDFTEQLRGYIGRFLTELASVRRLLNPTEPAELPAPIGGELFAGATQGAPPR